MMFACSESARSEKAYAIGSIAAVAAAGLLTLGVMTGAPAHAWAVEEGTLPSDSALADLTNGGSSDSSLADTSGDAVYRMYNHISGEHLYTTDYSEVVALYQLGDWGYEGIGWYGPDSDAGAEPVWRLYNPGLSTHLYTKDAGEAYVLTTEYDWQYDNNANPMFYSGGDIDVYRLYDAAGGVQHHYTYDVSEYNALPDYGWNQEGVSFKAVKGGIAYTATHYYPEEMNAGWLYGSDGLPHYCVDGVVQTGWVWAMAIDGSGYQLFYIDPVTTSPKVGFFELDGSQYYATESGLYVVRGKTLYGDGMLLSDNDGRLVTQSGWVVTQTFDGDWQRYYIDNCCGGHMGARLGWFFCDGYWHYGTEYGYVARNTYIQDDATWYEFDNEGNGYEVPTLVDMKSRVQGLDSQTEWLIAYDVNTCWLGIFSWNWDSDCWDLYNSWRISTGTDETPSLQGEYEVGARGYSFGTGYTCYYYTQILGDYLFHSAMYEQGTFNNIDQGLGLHTTGGCVRMDIDNAKWIYDNIPTSTKILGYWYSY